MIAIIGGLVALLLPAVQAARESARRSQCSNNLKQVALAVELHHDARERYPAGRTGVTEFTTSWAFHLLEYLESGNVFRTWMPNKAPFETDNAPAMRTPIATYYCPSRRTPAADRDFVDGSGPTVLAAGVGAGGDYAANAGRDKLDYGVGEGLRPLPRVDHEVAGPMFTFSRIQARQVADGLSKTIAVGERHLPPPPDNPPSGLPQLAQGDTAFFSGDIAATILRTSRNGMAGADTDPSAEKFGSEHDAISYFAFLDGHVQPLSEDIDDEAFQLLTSIGDGRVVAAEDL